MHKLIIFFTFDGSQFRLTRPAKIFGCVQSVTTHHTMLVSALTRGTWMRILDE